jgi:hypothetical protein
MDVGEADEFGFRYPFTAIARMLGFGLGIFRPEQLHDGLVPSCCCPPQRRPTVLTIH